MKKLAIAVFAAIALSGCATAPSGPSNRGEWEQIHVRSYDGVTPRQAQDAAEKILKLADKDFKFEYPESGLVGSRKWMVYAAIVIAGGTDYWTIDTKQEGEATRVTVRVTRNSGATTVAPVIGGPGVAPMVSSTPGIPVEQATPYRLFWERMDYSLGKRSDWTTCDTLKARLKTEGVKARDRAHIDTLCAFNTDDKSPEAI